MKTRAAVLHGVGQDFEIKELDLDPPGPGEVLIRFTHAGLCHSDEHLRTGDLPPRFPLVAGHEGAGIIEEVGPGVERVAVGDHVVCAFIPSCGRCRYCSTGRQNLCDMGATILDGHMPDGSFRFHADGEDYGAMCMLGTFSERSVISEKSCVKVDDDIPLDKAVLCGCGVPTGWGSAVYSAGVRPGDTVVIYGIGGIGANAVQGAAHAGATNVIAVDPLPMKRERAEELGATHSFADAAQARETVEQLTRGQYADSAIVTVDVVAEEVVQQAVDAVGKDGVVVITGLADPSKHTVNVSGTWMTLYQKTIKGSLFGGSNPVYDIPKALDLYRAGQIKLDELVTKTYTLDEINQGYQDLNDGKNIRGVLVHAS